MAILSSLRSDARILLGMVDDTLQITEPQLTEWANKWLRYTAAWLRYPIAEETQAAVVSTATYTIATDFIEIMDVYYNNGKLFVADEDFLSGKDPYWRDSADGLPIYFIEEEHQKIRLWPPPNDTKNILFRLRVVPTAMSADGDTPDLPTSLHDTAQFFMAAMGHWKLKDFDKGREMWNKYMQIRTDLKNTAGITDEYLTWRWV